MKIKGEIHPHIYETIISQNLFDKCQIVRTSRAQNRTITTQKKQFLFSGLIKCAVSDRQVTCDLKKGKYVYLICRNPENHKKKMWIREKDVLEQIETALQPLMIPDEEINTIIAYIKKTSASEQSDHRDNQRKYRKELSDVDTQIDRLTDLLVNNYITEDAYRRKCAQLQVQRNELDKQLTIRHITAKETEQALIKLVKFMNKIEVVIKSSKNDQIRMLLKTLFSNLYLNGRNVRYDWVSGMWKGCNARLNQEWLGWQDSNLRMPIPKTSALPLGYTPTIIKDHGKIGRSFNERKMVPQRGFEPLA